MCKILYWYHKLHRELLLGWGGLGEKKKGGKKKMVELYKI